MQIKFICELVKQINLWVQSCNMPDFLILGLEASKVSDTVVFALTYTNILRK